jgi:hypothetical protein
MSVPAIRFASAIAVFIDFDASSIFVMLPRLTPCDLALPEPVIEMPLPLSPISAISAQTFVEPMSMAKTVLLKL